MPAPAEAQTFLRRIEILQRLPARGTGLITAAQMTAQLTAAGFPVQKRTVERDLEFLRDCPQGFGALHCDDRSKPFGWSIERSTARRAHMGLSVDEALAFAWVAQHGRDLLPWGLLQSLSPFFREAEARLQHDARAQAWLQHKTRVIAARPVALPQPASAAVMRAVTRSLNDDVQLQIQYRNAQGASKQMTVSPLALVSRDLNLYLVVWIPRYANLRVLHLSRMQSARVKEEKSEAPADFDIDAYIAQGPFQLGGEEAVVRLHFTQFAGHALLDAPMGADQQVHRQTDDGELALSAKVRVSPQFKAWLLGFGASVEVLAPESLRLEVGQTLEAAAKAYRGRQSR